MESRKVVYNSCFGGFGLSDKAINLYLTKKGVEFRWQREYSGSYFNHVLLVDGSTFYAEDLSRTDPILVEVVEELGSEEASGFCASLQIQEIESLYRIEYYDGKEVIICADEQEWL